jgi:hypothetical protein
MPLLYALVLWSFLIEIVGTSITSSQWLLDTALFTHVGPSRRQPRLQAMRDRRDRRAPRRGPGSLAGAVFGRARRPAIRARPLGALLRVTGLVASAAGAPRAGTPILVAGCLVPPRSTAPDLSIA